MPRLLNRLMGQTTEVVESPALPLVIRHDPELARRLRDRALAARPEVPPRSAPRSRPAPEPYGFD